MCGLDRFLQTDFDFPAQYQLHPSLHLEYMIMLVK